MSYLELNTNSRTVDQEDPLNLLGIVVYQQ